MSIADIVTYKYWEIIMLANQRVVIIGSWDSYIVFISRIIGKMYRGFFFIQGSIIENLTEVI